MGWVNLSCFKKSLIPSGISMSGNIEISIDEMGPLKRVRVMGRIDASSAVNLEKQVLPILNEKKKILMDFTRVQYLSSAGMRLMLSATKKLKALGGAVVFYGLNDQIMEIVKMAGFDRVLQICLDEKTAVKALNS